MDKIIKFLLVRVGIVCQVIHGFYIYLISSKPKILILNPIKSAKKIAIFAAYRKNFDMSVDLTLCELKKRGFKVVFVSNCKLNKEFIHQLKNKADIVIERANYGRCMAAYKVGFLFIKSNNFYSAKDILFMNDTTIFPIFNADKFWRDMDICDAQIAGVYESNEFYPHIQSFFIYCKNYVFLKPSFINFWIKYKSFNAKQSIIKFGEIGFSIMARSNNFKLYSFINFERITKCYNKNFKSIKKNLNFILGLKQSNLDLNDNSNPSHKLALFCLVYLNLPLLKTDLLSAKTFSLQQVSFVLKRIIKCKINTDYILSALMIKKEKSMLSLYRLKHYMGMI